LELPPGTYKSEFDWFLEAATVGRIFVEVEAQAGEFLQVAQMIVNVSENGQGL